MNRRLGTEKVRTFVPPRAGCARGWALPTGSDALRPHLPLPARHPDPGFEPPRGRGRTAPLVAPQGFEPWTKRL